MNPAVLIVGAGTTGRRRAASLAALGAQVALADVDAGLLRQQCAPVVRLRSGSIPHGFDAVVIATPADSHAELAYAALAAAPTVFVEPPLASSPADGRALVEAGRSRLVVGGTLRHHEPLRQLVDAVRNGRIGAPSSIRLRLGGGVADLDLALWVAGSPLEIVSVSGDGRTVSLIGPSGLPVRVDIDPVSGERGVEVEGDRVSVHCEWSIDTSMEPALERESQHLLDVIAGAAIPSVPAAAALAALELADHIRTATGVRSAA